MDLPPIIMLAHELRSYRQAMARALRVLRPGAEVIEVGPEELDAQAERFAPDVVICSRATPAVRHIASAWVELYRNHDASVSCVSVAGKRSVVVGGMGLDDLLAIIDGTNLP